LLVDRVILPEITSGEATISVPNVSGKSLDAAKLTIESKGLKIEVAKEVYSVDVRTGQIVNQLPASGSIVKKGRSIYVTVSKGKELVPVPYITGLLLRTAKINLMKAGLDIGDVTYDYSESIGKDTIISQSISPTTKVPYGEHVSVVISKGTDDQSKIPSLIGLSAADAKLLIEESGFVLGTTEYKSDATYLPDVVVGQFPHPGDIAAGATVVNITITK
jgi:serine/threonine-protein kinase